MIIYIIMLLLVAITTMLATKNRKKYIIPFMVMFTLAALRGSGMGADYRNYFAFFHRYRQYDLKQVFSSREFGYVLLNKIISLFSNEFQWVIAAVSFLALIGVWKFIYEYSAIPWLSIWIYISMYFYQDTFTRLRQAVAISLVLIAYKYALEKKLIKFLLLIFGAVTFHNTAIVALCIYPFVHIKLQKKHMLFLSVILALFVVFRENLFLAIVHIVAGRYSYYSMEAESGGGRMLFILYLIIFSFIVISIFNFKKVKSLYEIKPRIGKIESGEERLNRLIVGCGGIMVVTQALATVWPLMNRLGDYFSIPVLLLLPNLIVTRFNSRDKTIICSVVVALSFAFYIFLLNSDPGYTVPFYFYSKQTF